MHCHINHLACGIVHAHFGTTGVMALPFIRASRLPAVVTFYGVDVSYCLVDVSLISSSIHRFIAFRHEVVGSLPWYLPVGIGLGHGEDLIPAERGNTWTTMMYCASKMLCYFYRLHCVGQYTAGDFKAASS